MTCTHVESHLFIYLYSFYHTNKRKKRKKMLTGKMCGMARTTELGSKLSVAVKEKRYKHKYIEYSKMSMSNLD